MTPIEAAAAERFSERWTAISADINRKLAGFGVPTVERVLILADLFAGFLEDELVIARRPH